MVTKSGAVAKVDVITPSDFPTLSGFAIQTKVHRSTLYEWSKTYPEFGKAYSWAEVYQENWLRINGLKGYISPPAYVWTSKNCIGDRDKVEQLVTSNLTVEASNGQGLLDEFKKVINDPGNERKA